MAYNYDSLMEPVTRQEIYEYKKNINRNRDIYSTFNLIGIIFGLIVSFVFGIILIIFDIFTLRLVGVGIICIAVFSAVSYYFLSYRKKIIYDIKLQHFASANDLIYDPQAGPKNSGYPGMIFNVGNNRIYEGKLCDKTGDLFEISNYRYQARSGNNNRVVENGYIMIRLDRNLPNIVMDSNKNNIKLFGINISNLPVEYKNNQKLMLEGDFNNYFSLYVPTGYERDALYIFTPDLMKLLVDCADGFDAEIVDNKLFLYSKRFDLTNQKTLKTVFEIIETVGQKMASRTDNYIDEKVADNFTNDIVSGVGVRLNKSIVSIGTVISIAIFILVYYLLRRG